MPSEYSRKWTGHVPLWLLRTIFFVYPPLLGTGFRIRKITPDYRHIEVELKLRWYNANIFGTHFGGSMYAMIDPFYALMIWRNLGDGYLVWDKSGSIEYLKPGRGVLKARFDLSEDDIQQIREQVAINEKFSFEKQIDIVDEKDKVVAIAKKTIFICKKKALI